MASIRVMFVLAVMLIAPATSAYDVKLQNSSEPIEEASANWHSISPIETKISGLKTLDYQIYLPTGSYDPISDDLPMANYDWAGDFKRTGMAIVQFNDNIGEHFYDLVDKYDLFVLDNVGSSSWLFRLSDPGDFSKIGEEQSVRWIGSMMPSWRVSSQLDEYAEYYSIIPAADIDVRELDLLALDLVRMGAEEAWCGLHLCEAKGRISIESLAKDGRIIFSDKAHELRITNAVAGAIVGLNDISNSNLGLTGSGEKISYTDTGIDQDHPDLAGRVAGVYTQFGLDPSPADSNGGHGTHIAITIAGSGTGDSSAKGIAPDALIVAYALEHDPTGVFGRIGSIYDMLNHAEQEGSRISVNAWGLNGNYGAYTGDSRSVDVFVKDNSDFLPVFSAGDDPSQNASKVMAPSTGKNVLSIGASTTNPSGSVANFSSLGPSLDGRVKPDLIAPGVDICSGRAQEAAIPTGSNCGSGQHANGNGLYMSLTGASQATAVAGGSISLIREFIREEVGIVKPSASLLKGAAINGAIDLGAPDIPNSEEGWGQISVANTVMPEYNGVDLSTYYDNSRVLSAGFSTLYQFDVNPGSGLDLTLTWTDVAGSANAEQNQSRLVNDLDLLLMAPDGTVFKGNVMLNGYSIPNGVHDSVNNVERIKINPSANLPAGKWKVMVTHAGGLDQAYSLILTGDATLDPKADLVAYDGSIFPSSESPLVNDLITIRIAWLNQGTANASQFRVVLEDLTDNTVLYDGNRSNLPAGQTDSLTIYHTFNSTGDHNMRLSIDTESSVEEINDEIDGVNNNIEEMTITVAALGVRLVTLNSEGVEDSSLVNQTLDPSTAEGYTWPVILKHEGTDQQSVKLQISQVQSPSPIRDDVLLPTEDDWSRSSDLSGPFTLSAMGQGGDSIYLNITMNDDDADLSGQTDRYAMAGTYVMDVTAKYSNNPSVKHSIRLRLVVEEVKDVQVAPAGTNGLEANPGGSTSFSISVRNTGNSPAVYDMDCFSENRWQVQLGQSNSSSYSFEPLDILEYLPMQIRLYVPPVVDGLPAAGSTDTITCSVTSEFDLSLNISETVTLSVKALESFETVLLDKDGIDIGPAAYARNINVDTGERLNLTLNIENTGNTNLDLNVRINPELTTWTIQVNHDGQTANREVSVSIIPGEAAEIRFEILVSQVAARNDENNLVIKTSQDPSNFLINETKLVVKDEIGLDFIIDEDATLEVYPNGDFFTNSITVENTGNSGISIDWTHSLPPDGWEVGFVDAPTYLAPREPTEVGVLIKSPVNEPSSESLFVLGIYAEISNGFDTTMVTKSLPVSVMPVAFCSINHDENDKSLMGIARNSEESQMIEIINLGNQPLDASVSYSLDASDWEVTIVGGQTTQLIPGGTQDVEIKVKTNDDTKAGIENLNLNCGGSEIVLSVSVQNTKSQGGLFGIVSQEVAYSVVGIIVLLAIVLAVRIKRAAPKDYETEVLIAPGAHDSADDGSRMQAVMESVVGEESAASGGVSAEEIASALAQSIPSLPVPPTPVVPQGRPPTQIPSGRPPRANVPTGRPPKAPVFSTPQVPIGPPLPPTGLPPGWTMEQWQHYGHQWIAQQGQK